MPRNRSKGNTALAEPPTTNTQAQESEVIMSSTAFEILDDEGIAELEQSARRRGEYEKVLSEFMASGTKAARVPTDAGTFAGKATSSVKTGFSNAIAKSKVEGATADTVEVLVAKEKVYLRRRDL